MTEKLITLCGLKNWDFKLKNKIRLKSHLSEWKLPKSSIPWNRHNQPVSIWQFIICNLSFSSHPPMSQCQTMARMSSIIVFFSSFIRRSWSRFRNCNVIHLYHYICYSRFRPQLKRRTSLYDALRFMTCDLSGCAHTQHIVH